MQQQSDRPSPLGGVLHKFLVTLVPLGLLLYGLIRGTEADLHLQIGVAAGFLVYIVTFIDLTLGLAILIACVGLSPELTIGSLQNLRLEDFVVPALIISWITRMMQQRIPLAPLLVAPALPLYAGVIVLSTLAGVTAEATRTGAKPETGPNTNPRAEHSVIPVSSPPDHRKAASLHGWTVQQMTDGRCGASREESRNARQPNGDIEVTAPRQRKWMG